MQLLVGLFLNLHSTSGIATKLIALNSEWYKCSYIPFIYPCRVVNLKNILTWSPRCELRLPKWHDLWPEHILHSSDNPRLNLQPSQTLNSDLETAEGKRRISSLGKCSYTHTQTHTHTVTCTDSFMDISGPVAGAQTHCLPVSLESETLTTGEQACGSRRRCSLSAGRGRQ